MTVCSLHWSCHSAEELGTSLQTPSLHNELRYSASSSHKWIWLSNPHLVKSNDLHAHASILLKNRTQISVTLRKNKKEKHVLFLEVIHCKSCILVDIYYHFGGICCHCFQGRSVRHTWNNCTDTHRATRTGTMSHSIRTTDHEKGCFEVVDIK